MKKFTKFFLLALCTGFLFLGYSKAKDGIEEDFYNNEIYIGSGSRFYSGNLDEKNVDYNPLILKNGDCHYLCGISLLGLLTQKLLIGIGIILGIMLIILYTKAIILCKKSGIMSGNNGLLYIPFLNLYPISKITIGSIGFFCIILMFGFFIYGIYTSITKNKCCIDNPSRQEYSGIVVGTCSIIILGVLLSKLSYLTKSNNKTNKEFINE